MAGAVSVCVAAVDDDRLLLDGLASCLAAVADVRLCVAAATVEEFLTAGQTVDVVLLDLRLRDGSVPTENVARLVAAGARVLVVSSHTDRAEVIATTAAGAGGYLTKDSDMAALVAALRTVANGGSFYSPELAFCWSRDRRPSRPSLSEQEERVLLAYAGGATLAAAARRAGIRPGTAKEYLDRVKQKYRDAHRPAGTKLELAQRVREDGLRGRA